jgi:hypothetical protein
MSVLSKLPQSNKGGAVSGASSEMARITGSTYSTIQHMQDIFHSAGVSSGGGITDDTDGTITVASGTGFIRATNSAVAEILFADWASEAGANVALTDNDMNYLYVEYNSGTPQVVATITKRTDENTNLFLGTVYRSGTTLHVTETTRVIVGDHAFQMIARLRETMPFMRVSGGISSETGTRNIAVTAGTWWEDLTRFTTDAIDTSGADTFTYYYSDGGSGWTAVTSQSAIDNTQYDDGDGGLGTLSQAKYGIHWLYLGQDGDFYILYGTVDGSLTEANDAGVPSSVPPHFDEAHARLIGKIVIQKSASTFTSIQSLFNGEFSLETATDHGGLIGLSDDDHTQYKMIAPRSATVASSATPTPDSDAVSEYTVTALAVGATFGAPTGTPSQGQNLIIRIEDDGTTRSLAWNAIYRASSDLALPTDTVATKTMYLGFKYNSTDSKWDFLALLDNI